MDGETTMRAPVGQWEVVVSRGYEYDLYRETVTVVADATAEVSAEVERVVDTTGIMCADYHIHTVRSADADDMGAHKVRSAAADGLDLPIRSEHEFVESFQPLVEQLGLQRWLRGMTSVEMTSMEIWGHMGVFPLEPDPSQINGGAPLWQEYPDDQNPSTELRTLSPPELFAAVRKRPEQPIIIINHPRGGANYFSYVGYDNVTGMVEHPEEWDEQFRVVEFFNDSDWLANRDGLVEDWLSFLRDGRRVFAVGSSDSHGVAGSPVGYPRTCLRVGTDDPMEITPNAVRDATRDGHSVVSGGIYLDVAIGEAGPGDEVVVGPTTTVRVRVQAAPWVDVDVVELVVDGEVVDTAAIPPSTDVIRYDGDIVVDTGGYVIVAAYGDSRLEPVHPGRTPFAVSNPIFTAQ
jgi:hypothetical protein